MAAHQRLKTAGAARPGCEKIDLRVDQPQTIDLVVGGPVARSLYARR